MQVTTTSSERDDTIKILRELCVEFGDNDWEDDLYLADIIEKHLAKYLWRIKEKISELNEKVDKLLQGPSIILPPVDPEELKCTCIKGFDGTVFERREENESN